MIQEESGRTNAGSQNSILLCSLDSYMPNSNGFDWEMDNMEASRTLKAS